MIAKALLAWRASWTNARQKHGLGPVDDDAWEQYLDALSNSQMLERLQTYESCIVRDDGRVVHPV